MNDEERSLLATRIMGWHLLPGLQASWFDSNGLYQVADATWNPHTDLQQAIGLVDAIGEMDIETKIRFVTQLEKQLGFEGLRASWGVLEFVFHNDKPLIIAEAALAVAKRMKVQP